MTTQDKTPEKPSGGPERRRADRFTLVLPIEVTWEDPEAGRVVEPSKAKNVNVHGALLQMARYPRAATDVELKNTLTGESARARVAAIRRSKDGKLLGVAVELLEPSEAFWGLTFQMQELSAQLAKLETSFPTEEVDWRLREELRDAVRHMCKTAAALQRWQDSRLEDRDEYALLAWITSERLRRGTVILDGIAADMDAMEITEGSEGLAEFCRAIERVSQRIAGTMRPTKPERF